MMKKITTATMMIIFEVLFSVTRAKAPLDPVSDVLDCLVVGLPFLSTMILTFGWKTPFDDLLVTTLFCALPT